VPETRRLAPSLTLKGDSIMKARWIRRTALALVLGFAAGAAPLDAWVTSSRLTYLTFNAAVALPGVTLPAGTYAFELAAPNTAANVVLVKNRARTVQFYSGFTRRVERHADLDHSSVAFGEARPGEPRPILVWYPPDWPDGLQFNYRR
jgi:hypothetical protein